MIQNIILNIMCKMKKLKYKIFYKNFRFENGLKFRKGFFVKIAGGEIIINKNCFFNNYCSITSMGKIEIGKGCIFGEGVKIYDHNHIFGKNIKVNSCKYKVKNVKIGDNVWVGSNTVILKGVNIGNNVVIGANSVIYKDIPDDSLVISKSSLEIRDIK